MAWYESVLDEPKKIQEWENWKEQVANMKNTVHFLQQIKKLVILTYADCCNYRGSDDGQGDASCDGQVPLVRGQLLQLVVSVDL